MYLSNSLLLRRIINYSYHPFKVIPKPSIWLRRERLKRFVAWQYASYRSTVKAAYKKLNKTFIYMDMQREDKSKLEIHYANERLASALEYYNMNYSFFKSVVDQTHILINKRILAQLALCEPKSFKVLAEITQNIAKKEKDESFFDENIEFDSSNLEEPFPYAKVFPKGPWMNHNKKPRLLKESEF